MKRDIVLVVDDQPERYAHLARQLRPHGIAVAVVCHPDAAEILLDGGRVICALLDHDMPRWNGQHYAREVFMVRCCPVAITSANHAGARAISAILREGEVPHAVMSVVDASPEERWLGFVLDWAGRHAEVTRVKRLPLSQAAQDARRPLPVEVLASPEVGPVVVLGKGRPAGCGRGDGEGAMSSLSLFGDRPEPADCPDVAYTPAPVALAIVEYLCRRYPLPERRLTMWEPFAGGGAFINAWGQQRLQDRVVASESDPGAPVVMSGRVPLADAWEGPPCPVDWVVTNPPFSRFDEALLLATAHARRGVAMLLVGQALAPGRRDWLWDTAAPDEMCWLTPRISFERPGKGGGTDMREYALVTWLRSADGWQGRMRLARLNWRTGQTWGAM